MALEFLPRNFRLDGFFVNGEELGIGRCSAENVVVQFVDLATERRDQLAVWIETHDGTAGELVDPSDHAARPLRNFFCRFERGIGRTRSLFQYGDRHCLFAQYLGGF